MKKTTLKKIGWRVVQIGGGVLIGYFIGDVCALALTRHASKIGKLACFAGGMLTTVCVADTIDKLANKNVESLTEQEEQEDSEVEETVTE